MKQSTDRTTAPAVSSFKELAIKNPTKRVLPNGIEVLSINTGDQPLNRITVSYPHGLLEAGVPDALHLATQLLREGTPSHSGSQISETLDYHGAWLKTDALSHDTAISLWSLNNSTSGLLPLLKEIIHHPSFPEKEFETLRQKHKAKYLLSQKNVSYMASLSDKQMVFGKNHPMTKVLDAEEIEALTADDIRGAYEKAFAVTPRIFVAGGEIDMLLDEICEAFSTMPTTPPAMSCQNIIPMRPEEGQRTAVTAVDAEHQAAIVMSLPTIDRSHPDYIPLRLAVMALGGYFGSRLMTNIREDKGYTYGIQANLLGYREGGVVSIMTSTAPQYVDAVICETRKEIMRLSDTLMDNEELATVKNNAMTSLAAILDTPFSIMDHHISQYHNGTPPDYFAKQVEAINSLTACRIMELSRQYLNPDKMLISIAGPDTSAS